MSEHEQEEEGGRFAVPGKESHESDETLTQEERGEDPRNVPPPSEPKSPSPG